MQNNYQWVKKYFLQIYVQTYISFPKYPVVIC